MALLALLFIFLLQFPIEHVVASTNSSFLELPLGLKLSMTNGTSTLGTPTLDDGGIFLPILSSPSFSTSNSSETRGFALGLYILPRTTPSDSEIISSAPCFKFGCSIYLSVCAGLLGSSDHYTDFAFNGAANQSPFFVNQTVDGFASPVWIANPDHPIMYVDDFSLVVVEVAGSTSNSSKTVELQLWDDGHVQWGVPNTHAMEMQDGGILVAYDSIRRTNVVWQSSTNSLLEGQRLKADEGQLLSINSAYSARMEKGGLVLYLNSAHFSGSMGSSQPTPYWIFPIIRNDSKLNNVTLNKYISSAPCSTSPAYMHSDPSIMSLYPGACGSGENTTLRFMNVEANFSWGFLRLENDGGLNSYTVFNPSGARPSASQFKPQLPDDVYYEGITHGMILEFLLWGECDVPMACGPAGVCTPSAKSFCTCADSFEPIDPADFSQGCKRKIRLPPCSNGNEHSSTTDFLQLNSTASIFLLNEWTYNPTRSQVDDCKKLCLSNCSCNGFLFQVDMSACFFITDEISLLAMVGYNSSTSVQDFLDIHGNVQQVFAQNYVAHLKVANVPTNAHNSTALVHWTVPTNAHNRTALVHWTVVVLSAVLACCLVLGLALHYVRARRKHFAHVRMQAVEEEELQNILPLLPRRFSYRELHEATQGFSKLLGAGGCGSVYAGELQDRKKVAVKILKGTLQSASQSKQFLAEVAAIGRTGHQNIVRLEGFCWEASHRLLVYEYLERGSLDCWLFVRTPPAAQEHTPLLLDWQTRYNVAVGVARGLKYLHEDTEQRILHFDIKPQNILLDDAFVAKLADFGMARLLQRDASSVLTGVRGTIGYIAPDWFFLGAASTKSDVYSMGMVILEIVGGRKILDFSLLVDDISNSNVDQEEWNLPQWAAKKCEQGLWMELVDKRLRVCGFDEVQAQRLIYIAFWCIQEEPGMRPNASTVVRWLESNILIEQPPFKTALNARWGFQDRPNVPKSQQLFS